MRLTDETGIPETRYFPVIAIDDSCQQKVHSCYNGYAKTRIGYRRRIYERHIGREVENMSKKRKSGEGTLRLRKDGRWEARIVVGYNDKGLPITKSATAKEKNALKS